MNARPHEPLSDEERELAAALRNLEAAGPSAALDARILAAARAAAPRPADTRAHSDARHRRRPRRLAWIAVPGSLVTGVGMAAVLLVTVGVVWQLRPPPAVPPPAEEGPGGVVEAEMIRRAPVAAPPPPPPAAATDASAHRPAGPGPVAAPTSAATGEPARPPSPQSKASPPDFLDEPLPLRDFRARSERLGGGETGLAREAPVATGPSRTGSASSQAAAEEAAASETRDTARAASPAAETARTSQPAELPRATAASVEQDARLPPERWIERIRERRDAGDLSGARASLERFQRAHPHRRVPDDLRSLRRVR